MDGSPPLSGGDGARGGSEEASIAESDDASAAPRTDSGDVVDMADSTADAAADAAADTTAGAAVGVAADVAADAADTDSAAGSGGAGAIASADEDGASGEPRAIRPSDAGEGDRSSDTDAKPDAVTAQLVSIPALPPPAPRPTTRHAGVTVGGSDVPTSLIELGLVTRSRAGTTTDRNRRRTTFSRAQSTLTARGYMWSRFVDAQALQVRRTPVSQVAMAAFKVPLLPVIALVQFVEWLVLVSGCSGTEATTTAARRGLVSGLVKHVAHVVVTSVAWAVVMFGPLAYLTAGYTVGVREIPYVWGVERWLPFLLAEAFIVMADASSVETEGSVREALRLSDATTIRLAIPPNVGEAHQDAGSTDPDAGAPFDSDGAEDGGGDGGGEGTVEIGAETLFDAIIASATEHVATRKPLYAVFFKMSELWESLLKSLFDPPSVEDELAKMITNNLSLALGDSRPPGTILGAPPESEAGGARRRVRGISGGKAADHLPHVTPQVQRRSLKLGVGPRRASGGRGPMPRASVATPASSRFSIAGAYSVSLSSHERQSQAQLASSRSATAKALRNLLHHRAVSAVDVSRATAAASVEVAHAESLRPTDSAFEFMRSHVCRTLCRTSWEGFRHGAKVVLMTMTLLTVVTVVTLAPMMWRDSAFGAPAQYQLNATVRETWNATLHGGAEPLPEGTETLAKAIQIAYVVACPITTLLSLMQLGFFPIKTHLMYGAQKRWEQVTLYARMPAGGTGLSVASNMDAWLRVRAALHLKELKYLATGDLTLGVQVLVVGVVAAGLLWEAIAGDLFSSGVQPTDALALVGLLCLSVSLMMSTHFGVQINMRRDGDIQLLRALLVERETEDYRLRSTPGLADVDRASAELVSPRVLAAVIEFLKEHDLRVTVFGLVPLSPAFYRSAMGVVVTAMTTALIVLVKSRLSGRGTIDAGAFVSEVVGR